METAINKYRREQKELKRKRREMYLTDDEWEIIKAKVVKLRTNK